MNRRKLWRRKKRSTGKKSQSKIKNYAETSVTSVKPCSRDSDTSVVDKPATEANLFKQDNPATETFAAGEITKYSEVVCTDQTASPSSNKLESSSDDEENLSNFIMFTVNAPKPQQRSL